MAEIITQNLPEEISPGPPTPLAKIQKAFEDKSVDGVYAALKETAAALGNDDPGISFEPGATEAAIKRAIGEFLESPVNALDVVVPGGNIAFTVDGTGKVIPVFGRKSPPALVIKWNGLHLG